MNFAHTFWSKPLLENKFADFKTSLEIILYTYNLSADLVKCYGHNITLYTDSYGANLLGFIPYDEIVVIDIDENESVHFAAQMKIKALERMQLGDILIDGDLFLWKHGIYDVLENSKADALASLYEPNDYVLSDYRFKNKYIKMISQLSTVEFEEPFQIKCLNDMGWPNTSLLKLNNQELKDKYIEQYNKHKAMLQEIDFKDNWPDVIIEQKFLEVLCNEHNYKLDVVIENFRENDDYAKQIGFTHLGSAKQGYLYLATNWLKENDKSRYDYIGEILKNIQNNK